MRQTTLIDIANKTGYSVSTVSRALKDHPDINKKTKQHIKSVSEEMRYTPNKLAQGLRNHRSKLIGVLIPDLLNEFFSSIVSGILQISGENDYQIILYQTNEDPDKEIKGLENFLLNRVDGVVGSLANTTMAYKTIQKLQEHQIPVTLLDKVSDKIHCPKVIINDYAAAFKATEYLIRLGRENVVHISGHPDSYNGQLRLNGYKDALKKYHLPVNDDLIFLSQDVSIEEGYFFGRRIAKSNLEIDGIFAATDRLAVGAIQALQEFDIQVPEQVSVVGFSDVELAIITNPKLTTIYQPGFEMGKKGMSVLLEQLAIIKENPKVVYDNTVYNMETELIVRGSTTEKE